MRLVKLTPLLAERDGRTQTILLGDMNARPGSPKIEMILAAGFVDAWAEAGTPEHPASNWIIHTADHVKCDALIIDSSALAQSGPCRSFVSTTVLSQHGLGRRFPRL